jgi:hypothetical protein
MKRLRTNNISFFRGWLIDDGWQMIVDRKNVLIRWSLIVGRWREEGSKYDSGSFYGANFRTAEIPLRSLPYTKEAQPLFPLFLCVSAVKHRLLFAVRMFLL